MASGPTTSQQIDGETMETVRDFILGGSKITADGDCSHEIKRQLLLERKAMKKLDSILKSRDITLPTKVHLVKGMVFPVVMNKCECWTIKKAERWRIDALEPWWWWCSDAQLCHSLQPHELQHTRHCCSLPSPEVCPSSCPLHWWHLPTTSSSKALFSFPSIFASIRDFSSESPVHIRWPKYWSFSFSISPSNEYSELISLKIDCFGILAIQGALRSLL